MAIFRPDIPFSRDDTNRFLPWIIAFIVFVAAMMMACGIGLYDIVGNRHLVREHSFSIHIPPSDTSDKTVDNLLSALHGDRTVQKAEPMGADEMRELVKPWLGADTPMDALPLPRIIEVTLSLDADMGALKRKILRFAPAAAVDDHAGWIAQYTSLVAGLEWGLWGVAGLFIIVTLAIVILTTRASIKIHHRVIHILHTIGALDSYIARQFQYNAFLVAAKGALGGCIVALGFYLMLCTATGGLDVPLLPKFALGLGQIALFGLMPLSVGLGALVSSRLTVLAELRRIP